MHPADCPGSAAFPGWEYKDFFGAAQALDHRSHAFLVGLRSSPQTHVPFIHNSRPVHRTLFEGLTPALCDYFAGHYRGEAFRCLKHYSVGVGADSRVGMPSRDVQPWMDHLARKYEQPLQQLDAARSDVGNPMSDVELLSHLVPIAADILEVFLTVHPYANGNGHIGRAIVWMLLGRYDVWPQSWPLDMRPPYESALSQHRDGNLAPLQALIYTSIY